VHGKTELLEVVHALHAGGGIADFLYRRQEQANQNGNDGDHHEQFDQREATPLAGAAT
jgi:hypothetical protein